MSYRGSYQSHATRDYSVLAITVSSCRSSSMQLILSGCIWANEATSASRVLESLSPVR